MTQSEKIDKIAPAIVALQAELPILKKTSDAHRNKYAKVEHFYEKAQPLMAKHGLALEYDVVMLCEDRLFLEGMLLHSSGQWIKKKVPYIPEEQTSQAYGGANTYAKRQLIGNILNMMSEGDDDDGQSAKDSYDKSYSGNPTKVISKKQLDWLEQIIDSNAIAIKAICNKYKVKSLNELTMGVFNEAKEYAEEIKGRMQ